MMITTATASATTHEIQDSAAMASVRWVGDAARVSASAPTGETARLAATSVPIVLWFLPAYLIYNNLRAKPRFANLLVTPRCYGIALGDRRAQENLPIRRAER